MIDLARKKVTVLPTEGPTFELSDDIIVVTAGAVTRRFHIPGIAEKAIGLKHVDEAVAIRDRLMVAVDRAAGLANGPERRRLLTATFVSGGFTGIEGFGKLLSLAHVSLKSYPQLADSDLDFHLVESGTPGHARGLAVHRAVGRALVGRAWRQSPSQYTSDIGC